MKLITLLILFVIVLSGCAPFPFQETPHIAGSVINSKTHQPITNARLHYELFPETIVVTSNNGNYDFAAIKEWQMIPLWPYDRARRTGTLIIEADGYITTKKEVFIYVEKPPYVLNIELEPRKK
jgi:hypothetical protein